MGSGFSFRATTPGLDPSWVYSSNYASAHGLRWGRDFISTYGPYGYALATMDVGDLVMRKIAFTLVLVTGTAIAVTVYLWSVPDLRPGTRLTLMVILIYACTVQSPEDQWFALLLLVLLMGVHGDGWKSLVPYAVAGLLAGFYMLMKFTLGIEALLTVAVCCLLIRRPLLIACRSFVTLCAATVGFLIGWLAYGGKVDDIEVFLTTAWEVTRGYSSAMSLGPDLWWIGAAGFLIWFLLLVLWALVQRGPRALLSLAVLALPLFVAWKHSVVRQGPSHVGFLIIFGIFVMLILLIDTLTVWRWRSALPVIGFLLIPLFIPWYSLPMEWRTWPLGLGLENPLRFRGLRDLVELRHLAAYRDRLAQESKAALREDMLPESMRSIIGSASVDVYPWEVNYVPANGLSWFNRPLPASFSAYTPILDRLDSAFFDSERRPQYLLWHTLPRGDAQVQSIDGRHVFWDEPKTLRAILDSYDLVKADQGIVLLRARAHPRFMAPQPLGTLGVPWDTWIQVPQVAGVLLANASIERSVAMRAIRTAFREPAVFLSLRFSSGEEVTFRIVPDNTAEGLWLSPFPESVDDLHTLLRRVAARRVVAVRFITGRLGRFYQPIVVSWFQLTPVGGTWAGVP